MGKGYNENFHRKSVLIQLKFYESVSNKISQKAIRTMHQEHLNHRTVVIEYNGTIHTVKK